MRAAPLARHGPVEEGQVGAGAARAISEEQVIGGRVVLVHGFLDPPQPQRFGIEPVVGRSVGGDRRQVVNTGELHVWPPVVAFRYRPRTPTPPAAPARRRRSKIANGRRATMPRRCATLPTGPRPSEQASNQALSRPPPPLRSPEAR